jgi:anti-sigma factor RsiW
MTTCHRWNDELVDSALGRTPTPELSAHLALCAECSDALEAWRARASAMDRMLTRLARPEPRSGGPERVLARIATTAPATAWLRFVSATFAMVVLACLIVFTARPVRTTASLSTWRSPTQSLLRSAADPLLRSVPRLGDGLLEMHPEKENYAQ